MSKKKSQVFSLTANRKCYENGFTFIKNRATNFPGNGIKIFRGTIDLYDCQICMGRHPVLMEKNTKIVLNFISCAIFVHEIFILIPLKVKP